MYLVQTLTCRNHRLSCRRMLTSISHRASSTSSLFARLMLAHCTPGCAGWTFRGEYNANSLELCIDVCSPQLLCTWWSAARRYLSFPVGSICCPPAATSCSYCVIGVRRLVVGSSRWLVAWPGTHYQTLCVIRHVLMTVSGVIWKLFFSLSTSVCIQRIRGFAIMHCVNYDWHRRWHSFRAAATPPSQYSVASCRQTDTHAHRNIPLACRGGAEWLASSVCGVTSGAAVGRDWPLGVVVAWWLHDLTATWRPAVTCLLSVRPGKRQSSTVDAVSDRQTGRRLMLSFSADGTGFSCWHDVPTTTTRADIDSDFLKHVFYSEIFCTIRYDSKCLTRLKCWNSVYTVR